MCKNTFNSVSFYRAFLLLPDEIPDFVQLQQKVWDGLPLHQKHFLKLREKDDLQTHMAARMPLIGVMDRDGYMRAQGLLSYPVHDDAVYNIEGYPIEHAATTALVQSVCSTEKGLAGMVLETAKDIAAMRGFTTLIAKVADDNVASAKSFLKNGFYAASHGCDPKKGYGVTYFRHDIGAVCAATSPAMAFVSEMA